MRYVPPSDLERRVGSVLPEGPVLARCVMVPIKLPATPRNSGGVPPSLFFPKTHPCSV